MSEETQLKSLNLTFKRKTKGGTIKATGKKAIVTVYTVSGNDESLARFKEIQGEYYSEDPVTGKPNFFTRRVLGGGNATLNFTQNNEFVYPTDNLGLIDYDQIMQQAQSEGDVYTQQEVAKRKIDILLGARSGNTAPVVTPQPVVNNPVTPQPEDPSDMQDLIAQEQDKAKQGKGKKSKIDDLKA